MIGVTWTGWDGSVWDLHNGPVYLAPGGISGLSMLTGAAFTRDTALADGQYFTGWRGDPRPVLLPVMIGQAATEGEWLALERAWWKTMRIDRAGTLTVTAPDGQKRTLKLRFVDDGDLSYKKDPTKDRLSIAPLKMIADDPWWIGETFDRTFQNGLAAQNFFGGAAGKATPFYIGSSNTVATATISNPGDVPAWPTYLVKGPATTFVAKVNGHPVAASIPLVLGQTLRVETSPLRQVVFLVESDGTETNVTRQMTSLDFAPIPDGDSITLDIQLSGAGSITILGDPKYYRAW